MSVAWAARDLDLRENVLRKWVDDFAADPGQVFPRPGQMRLAQREIERLRREVAKLKAARDILKKGRGLFREGSDMRFAFIPRHRSISPVASLCDALDVSRSGFHTWLTRSPSQRSQADEVVGAKVYASFKASDRTSGARRVWHDSFADGVSCGFHMIERLMRSQALRARPRRRSLPKDKGARLTSVIAPNVLDGQF